MRLPTRLLILGVGDTIVGFTYALQSPSRSSSRAYADIKTIADVSTWGAVLALIGVLLLVGVIAHPHVTPAVSRPIETALAVLAVSWASFWGLELYVTAARDLHVSYVGCELWLFFVVMPHGFLAFGREG